MTEEERSRLNRGAQSMNGFTGFYFSFITVSTVGYGDITPVSRIARWLAAMEAMTGLLYVAILIARWFHFIRVRNPIIPDAMARISGYAHIALKSYSAIVHAHAFRIPSTTSANISDAYEV